MKEEPTSDAPTLQMGKLRQASAATASGPKPVLHSGCCCPPVQAGRQDSGHPEDVEGVVWYGVGCVCVCAEQLTRHPVMSFHMGKMSTLDQK